MRLEAGFVFHRLAAGDEVAEVVPTAAELGGETDLGQGAEDARGEGGEVGERERGCCHGGAMRRTEGQGSAARKIAVGARRD